MMNSIAAAQHSHTCIYRGWEVESHGNLLAHAILRCYINQHGKSITDPCLGWEKTERLIYELAEML